MTVLRRLSQENTIDDPTIESNLQKYNCHHCNPAFWAVLINWTCRCKVRALKSNITLFSCALWWAPLKSQCYVATGLSSQWESAIGDQRRHRLSAHLLKDNDKKVQHTLLAPEDKQYSNCSHSNDMQSMLLPAGEISSSRFEKLINALISVLHKHGGEV